MRLTSVYTGWRRGGGRVVHRIRTPAAFSPGRVLRRRGGQCSMFRSRKEDRFHLRVRFTQHAAQGHARASRRKDVNVLPPEIMSRAAAPLLRAAVPPIPPVPRRGRPGPAPQARRPRAPSRTDHPQESRAARKPACTSRGGRSRCTPQGTRRCLRRSTSRAVSRAASRTHRGCEELNATPGDSAEQAGRVIPRPLPVGEHERREDCPAVDQRNPISTCDPFARTVLDASHCCRCRR